MEPHYNQKRLRNAEFIQPPNSLKMKVGSGGLSESILEQAQKLLENNSLNFQPVAEEYLVDLMAAVENARLKNPTDNPEPFIESLLFPSVHLKANGSMFSYPLVSNIADRMVQFLEVIEEADSQALDVITGFHNAIRAVLKNRLTGQQSKRSKDLLTALENACMRYFEKNPDNIDLQKTGAA